MRRENRLLLMDIGNTSVHLAAADRGHIIRESRILSAKISKKSLESALKSLGEPNYSAAIIASVVPSAAKVSTAVLRKKLACSVFEIGKNLKVPIPNRYKNPRQVGVDRLLNAYAAFQKYKKSLIVIDFGTAVTFDIVSKTGEYLGGVISPGIEISLDALFSRTALLPRIQLHHPKTVVGKDTIESIRIGCSVGIGGLCDRVVEAIARKLKARPTVIATGGYAHFMKRYCRRFDKIEPRLVLEGILLTYSHHLTNQSK